MAQKIQVLMQDDIDSTPADETVQFTIDGITYEIDLSSKNAKKFRSDLSVYTEHARKVRAPKARQRPRAQTQTSEIRRWAKSKGIHVNERGRIPASVMAKYESSSK